MSLTSFIKIPDVKERLSEIIKKPNINLNKDIKAIPLTKNYSLVGTAFDYLLRFVLEANFKTNKEAWVAEHSMDLIEDKTLKGVIETLLQLCKEDHSEFIKTKRVTESFFESCIILAKIDLIYRCGIIEEGIGNVEKGDIQDLINLYNTLNLENFKPKKYCLLNPTFNDASFLVGGADADLVIDDTIIDIKTTKKLMLTKDYLHQLVGYYFLYKIGGFSNLKEKPEINFVGIYFSRFGLLYKIQIKDILDLNKIDENIKWFINRANDENYLSIIKD